MLNDLILLVDDEKDITKLIEEALHQEGFINIQKVDTGMDAVNLSKTLSPSLIVLDVMLPDIDGIEVCRRIRSFTYCPIIFLSAKGDDLDKIIGLSSGGDDYITKPFSVKELVFRIKAQLRRLQYSKESMPSCEKEKLQVGNIEIDLQTSCVTKNGKPIELTAKEFRMLQYMMENKERILSKERIYENVWGELSAVCDNTIMVHIRHLREKIEEDPSNPSRLLTIKGLGYKMTGGES